MLWGLEVAVMSSSPKVCSVISAGRLHRLHRSAHFKQYTTDWDPASSELKSKRYAHDQGTRNACNNYLNGFKVEYLFPLCSE